MKIISVPQADGSAGNAPYSDHPLPMSKMLRRKKAKTF
ncbi:hypothetical protein HM1_2407 [Heliomicrobium modesticaldum Ice1]|uniref:Uncharacterized protein n=1 Tax=Heliobacterium modesticaldum (strain ATCC 51547 / Ice1) TaxID=498761 RepID=B0TIL6_HELMI|nr:hypothetical protein HM1_2407 [Heliomicrobium modesticaldum Ice1]